MADELIAKGGQTERSIVEAEEGEATIWSRRDFFSLAGWGGILAALAAGGLAFGRFMFPRVLFEPSPIFKAGLPEEYPVGTVSERWKQEQRVWIVHDPDGFYALLAICTHLGCTVPWREDEGQFHCPCHSSLFNRQGEVTGGPAPRPLDLFPVSLRDSNLVVDTGQPMAREVFDVSQVFHPG